MIEVLLNKEIDGTLSHYLLSLEPSVMEKKNQRINSFDIASDNTS